MSTPTLQGRPSRVVVEAVRPVVDAGAFPAKAPLGEPLTIVADVFTDGHDAVAASVRWRHVDAGGEAGSWRETPMAALGNDRFSAVITLDQLGRSEYEVIGWIDHLETWRRDTAKKLAAGVDVSLELISGARLIGDVVDDGVPLSDDVDTNDYLLLAELRRALLAGDSSSVADDHWTPVFRRTSRRDPIGGLTSPLPIDVDPLHGAFGSWYEFFPRSRVSDGDAEAPTSAATLVESIERLDHIADMGFDVVYLPPVHPIGFTKRKGRNNSIVAGPDDVGSPWAIGSSAGGHTAVAPELGTVDDVTTFATACRARGMYLAMDIAFQCSPDHPWVTEHPEWFAKRADGSIQFAENPPKRYEDIYPLDFESDDWRALWDALADVFRFWIDRGVTVFRVDNPHTKAFAFWHWALPMLRREHPDTVFLAEAFTRPRLMERLAKVGFNQSYTYFAWKQSSWELRDYFTDLATRTVDYLRPNAWPNTPDILTEQLQTGGRPAFVTRAILAATLSPSWGVYGPAFELIEHHAVREGSEEYLDSEKYQLRTWDLGRENSLAPLLTRLNRIRGDHRALRSLGTLRFHSTDDPGLLCYTKTDPAGIGAPVIVVVDLDPFGRHAGMVDIDLAAIGLPYGSEYDVVDELGGVSYRWHGNSNFVDLAPWSASAHIFTVHRVGDPPPDAHDRRRDRNAMTEDWFRDAVIYELHVRAFADSNGDGTGDLDGLTSHLDYLSDLGVTALWLLPFYPSPLRDDGYDIADYRTVNADYGDLRAFRRFLDAAHGRNLKVITELVINHTSDQHPWFERARRAPKGSAHRDFYVWSDDPTQWSDARIIFQDFESSNWTWDPVAGQYFWHRFYSHQPDLNFDNPAVETAVLDVLDHWLDMGVDGLRLDAVPYLYERDGTNCENLPETHAMLKRVRAHMDAKYDGRMLLAEANQWPEDAAAYFGDGDECHMNFHFPVMPRLFMSLQSENRMPIIDILDQTPTPPPNCQWATFLRNHDELTLEMVTEEERHMMLRAYARDDEMRINLGIRRRLAPLLGNDRRKIELLNAVLFSLPGTPVVYYGDEIGMGDNVYLGDRDGVRTPMQWTSDRNAGFSTANPHRLYLPLITEQEYHYESINVETQHANPASLLSWMRQLIALRTRHRVLGRGDITFLDPDNPHVLAFIRRLEGEPPMLCVANLSRLAQHVELDLREHQGITPVEVFGQNRFAPIRDHDYQVTLAPYGFFWLSLVGTPADIDATNVPILPGSMTEVLRRRAGLGRALERWLPSRRWFAGKGRIIRTVTVDDSVALDGDGNVALLVVSVSFTEGDDQRYAVPLMRISREVADAHDHPGAVVAQLDDGALLIDAMADPRGASAVIGAALRRRTRATRRGELRGIPRRARLATAADDPRSVQLLGVEQSNSSAIVDGRLIAKLVRRLEPGLNPDVELPTHLRLGGFTAVPGVAATLDIDLVGESSAANVVVVHDAVAHESDLWTRMLDDLGLAIDLGVVRDTAVPAVPGHAIAEMLGHRTAELHRCLATAGAPHMRPEPFTLHWQRSLLQTLRNAVRSTQRDLQRARRSGRLDDRAVEQAAYLDAHTDQLFDRFERLRVGKLDAHRIRIHGDLHLGQILWTGHDMVFIDFEGEPGAPMAQRTIKRSPLADVAGLVRSFDYAGRMAVHTAVERGRIGEVEEAAVEEWRRTWTHTVESTLLTTYLADMDPAGLIPADPADRRLLLDVYVLVKAMYEVRYELANRPDWVTWPLSAIADLLVTGSR